MSLGRVFAATALALWDIKVHEGKNAVLKVAQHAKVMTAAVQLRRPRRRRRETRSKSLSAKSKRKSWRGWLRESTARI